MTSDPDRPDPLADHSMTVSDNAEPPAEDCPAPTTPAPSSFRTDPSETREAPKAVSTPNTVRVAAELATPPPPPNTPAPPAKTDQAPAPAIFSQQLWEVQLLIDFLSGNPTRRLPDRTSAETAGLPSDWIEQICQMTWPPTGSSGSQADQEALLVKVKDYLNAMAAPANGFSVAFTLLVTQEDDTAVAKETRSRRPDPHLATSSHQSAMTESRGSLARNAYPALAPKSKSFRTGIRWIAAALTVWLAVTCGLSWYLSLGNADLAQLATAQAALADAQVKTIAAQSAEAAAPSSTNDSSEAAPANASPIQPSTQKLTKPSVAYCDQSKLLPPVVVKAGSFPVYVSATQSDLCEKLSSAQAALAAAQANVRGWLWFGRFAHPDDDQSVLYVTAVVNMLGSAILPVCYGILGAAAAVLRLLSKRMRLSLLTPRDLTLALQQLALGAVVGACIGLFVAGPGAQGADANDLLGPVKLSGSALSFVAGFGVDAVFSTLEALIARLFNTTPPAASGK